MTTMFLFVGVESHGESFFKRKVGMYDMTLTLPKKTAVPRSHVDHDVLF
jgi:hypothetical protein